MIRFEELLSVLKPPVVPLNRGNESEWFLIENKLGTKLPSDYKEFINIFGTGAVDNFIWVLNPFEKATGFDYFRTIETKLWAYSEGKRNSPLFYQHDLFPEKDGLLPFAVTDNGDELYWLTKGEPDSWRIIAYESRGPEYFEYDGSMISFFYNILTKKIICTVFPDDFPSQNTTFSNPEDYSRHLRNFQ